MATTPSPGRIFGDYELIEQLGRGGMGVVYLARQRSLHRLVALKMLLDSALSSPATVRRFQIESETVARLDHPAIVPIYEVGQEEDQHFFSMKLIEGRSLAAALKAGQFTFGGDRASAARQWQMVQTRIVNLMLTIGRAVDYAHSMGVLHRDLKPSNILLDVRGEPHLTDFGLAKADLDHAITPSGTALGTPAYMAPEQALGGPATRATDIYALGVIFYELCTGKLPFRGTTPLETLRRVTGQDPVPVRTLNRLLHIDLAIVCEKAMEKNPLRRYATAGELVDDLERWSRHEPIRARPAGIWLRTNRWIKRNTLGAALIVVLCAGLACSAVLSYIALGRERSRRIAVQTLRLALEAEIQSLPYSERAFMVLTSDQLRAFSGREMERNPSAHQFIVATFIDYTPAQTTYAFSKLLGKMEQSVEERLKSPVRFDLRIYRDYAAACDDIAAGKIQFAYVDAMLWHKAHERNPAVRGIVCDRRPAMQAVIFAQAAQTNLVTLSDLRGTTIAARDSWLPTLLGKAALAQAGLCASNIPCVSLSGQETVNTYTKQTKYGSGTKAQSLVRAVLVDHQFAAGIALQNQLRAYQENRDWRRLASFQVPEFIWISGPGVTGQQVDAFVFALGAFDNAKDMEALLIDTDSPGFRFSPMRKDLLDLVHHASQMAREFENCAASGPP